MQSAECQKECAPVEESQEQVGPGVPCERHRVKPERAVLFEGVADQGRRQIEAVEAEEKAGYRHVELFPQRGVVRFIALPVEELPGEAVHQHAVRRLFGKVIFIAVAHRGGWVAAIIEVSRRIFLHHAARRREGPEIEEPVFDGGDALREEKVVLAQEIIPVDFIPDIEVVVAAVQVVGAAHLPFSFYPVSEGVGQRGVHPLDGAVWEKEDIERLFLGEPVLQRFEDEGIHAVVGIHKPEIAPLGLSHPGVSGGGGAQVGLVKHADTWGFRGEVVADGTARVAASVVHQYDFVPLTGESGDGGDTLPNKRGGVIYGNHKG